jgi:hypothetical protein
MLSTTKRMNGSTIVSIVKPRETISLSIVVIRLSKVHVLMAVVGDRVFTLNA